MGLEIPHFVRNVSQVMLMLLVKVNLLSGKVQMSPDGLNNLYRTILSKW